MPNKQSNGVDPDQFEKFFDKQPIFVKKYFEMPLGECLKFTLSDDQLLVKIDTRDHRMLKIVASGKQTQDLISQCRKICYLLQQNAFFEMDFEKFQ